MDSDQITLGFQQCALSKMFHRESVLLVLGVVAFGGCLFVVKDECPPNEEYLLCGPCASNCSNPDPDPALCGDDCEEGCFCIPEFLRNDNGTCVTSNECETKPQCGENEEFLSCGSACPPTCAQPEPLLCDIVCKTGCFCKPGFVKDEGTGLCVTADKCPAEPCLNTNEVYDQCNAGCEPTCYDPEPICTKICIGGCVCTAGLHRNETGDCIPVDQCASANGTDIGLLTKYLNVINRILTV